MPEAPPDHVLRIDDDTWEKLEKHLGKKLGKWARKEIIAAVDQFVMAQYFRSIDDYTLSRLRGSRSKPTSISKLRTNLVRVLENWGDIQNDPTAQQFMEVVSNDLGLGDVDDIMWRLRHLNSRLDPCLNPPKKDPFIHYVERISLVYEKVTGKPVTIAIPTGYYENETTSTFVMVMMTLDAVLPDYAQKKALEKEASEKEAPENEALEKESPSPAAWAQALYRARKV